MSPVSTRDTSPLTLTKVLSIVVEKQSSNLLVLLVCASMTALGIYTFQSVILPLQKSNQDVRDNFIQRTAAMEKISTSLETAASAAERTAIIQQKTTELLTQLVHEVSRKVISTQP